jgi:hypothetical protein
MCIVEVLAAGPSARARRADTMARLADLQQLRGDQKLSKLAAQKTSPSGLSCAPAAVARASARLPLSSSRLPCERRRQGRAPASKW